MIHLVISYNKKNFIGNVIKLNYIIVLKTKKKKKKIATFTGICISCSAKFFSLVNVVKKERIFFNFDVESPFMYKIDILSKYKKMLYRVSKLYFKIYNYYFDDSDDFLVSNLESFKMDFFFSSYLKKKIVKKKKKLKKFKRKYSHTENWKNLKEEIYENFYDSSN